MCGLFADGLTGCWAADEKQAGRKWRMTGASEKKEIVRAKLCAII